MVRPAARMAKHGDGRFAVAVTLVFVSVAALSAGFHEPWRDEAQAWLLARDSSTLAALLANARYEGGPILWHVLLFPLAHRGGPALMSVLNLAFAAGAVFLFARFSPFDRWARALFAVGYLPLHEWGTLARNYAVGVFFLFLFAVAFCKRRPILQGLALAAAANTSIHAALVSASVLAFGIAEGAFAWRERDSRERRGMAVGLGLAGAGLLVSLPQILPPAGDRLVWVQPASLHRLWSVLCAFPAGFAPFADCWFAAVPLLGSPWVKVPASIVAVVLTLALLAVASAFLARRRAAWMVAALSVAMLGGLFFWVLWRGPRHSAFLFLATLLALWLAHASPRRALAHAGLDRTLRALEPWLPRVLHAVLVFHALVGAIAVAVEVGTVFSAARPTADLIRQGGMAGLPVVADPDFVATGVVAQLGIGTAYYPLVQRWGSFARWGEHLPDRSETAPDGLVFEQAAALAKRSDVLVLVNREPDGAVVARAGATLVAARPADIVRDESFWVYRLAARGEVQRP